MWSEQKNYPKSEILWSQTFKPLLWNNFQLWGSMLEVIHGEVIGSKFVIIAIHIKQMIVYKFVGT